MFITVGTLPREKRLGCDFDQLPPSSVEAKKWVDPYLISLIYEPMKQRDDVTLYLHIVFAFK
jgi:hypothetical protein